MRLQARVLAGVSTHAVQCSRRDAWRATHSPMASGEWPDAVGERSLARYDPASRKVALFYQLKGVPEDEAKTLAARLIAQPESALSVFIPIIPFLFTGGYPAIIASFVISTLARFLIGTARAVMTGLSP
jgi:hypothetical protein